MSSEKQYLHSVTESATSHPSIHKKCPFAAILMWIVSVCFVEFQFFLQLSAGVMIAELIQSFHITALGAGILSGSFYIIYVLMQTPAGMLVDRIGARRLLTVGALICGIGCMLFASSQSLGSACFARILMGGGSSFAFVSTLYIIGRQFPVERFALMTGLTETFGMVSVLSGNIILANALQYIPWRGIIWVASGIAMLLSILCYTIIHDRPQNPITHEPPLSLKQFITSVRWMLDQPWIWFNGLFAGLLFSMVTVFAALWSLPYLVLVQQVSLSVATFESSFIFIGLAVGGPISGYIYYRIQNIRSILIIASILSATISAWIIYATPQSIALCALLFFGLGIMCSTYVFNYTLAKEATPVSLQATSIGFTNTICMITAPLLQPLIGWLLHISISASSATGIQETYSVANYQWAMALIPFTQILALIVAFFIPKKRNLHYKP